MGERSLEPAKTDPLDDIFEFGMGGELSELELQDMSPVCSDKQRLAQLRRRAEQRLEEKRMRDELGDYDLEFDDF